MSWFRNMVSPAQPPVTAAPSVDNLQAKLPDLRIAIIGGGVGGLAAALALKQAGFQSVTIYEQSRFIQEVGAGIQVAPNMARLLRRWGCLDELGKTAVTLRGNSIRRYADDHEIGTTNFAAVEEKYHAPIWVVHRADLQACLLDAGKRAGVDLRTSARVVDIESGSDGRPTRVCVQQRGEDGGTWEEVDVVVAADGIRSPARAAIMKKQDTVDEVEETGDAAYRIVIPRSKFEEANDPELMKVIDEPFGMRWIGPGGHTMAYPIRAHQLYNMVLVHPTRPDVVESWTSAGPRQFMDDFYGGWCPRLNKLLSMFEGEMIPEWNLRIHKPLATWVDGSLALLGDACHSTLPYVSQGAAQACEDAGVLAAALALCATPEHINPSLLVYQEVRKARAEHVVASASQNRLSLHLPDGPAQARRDDLIARASAGESVNPDLWGDKDFQKYVWGQDVQAQTISRYDDLLTEALAKKAIYPNATVLHGMTGTTV